MLSVSFSLIADWLGLGARIGYGHRAVTVGESRWISRRRARGHARRRARGHARRRARGRDGSYDSCPTRTTARGREPAVLPGAPPVQRRVEGDDEQAEQVEAWSLLGVVQDDLRRVPAA